MEKGADIMAISYRLKYIADLVTPGYIVADIGTDHGYVPLYLLKEGRIPYAIGVDLSRGSLQKARENAVRFRLSEKMDLRPGDGLSPVRPGEAQSIIICGMGGILMRRILEEGRDTALGARELILSPHRNPELIRAFLLENGFCVIRDEQIEDKMKKYQVFKGVRPTFFC